jgi:hypothetical protein
MFAIFGEVWPRDGERVSDLTLEVYARVLADIPDDLLQAAIVQMLASATFYPKPAEIRRMAASLRWPEEITGLEAWGRLGAYMRDWPAGGRFVGDRHVDPPALPERTQRAVAAIGGLSYLRYSENVMADRARFCEVYDALSRREREHAQMLPEVRAVVERLQAAPAAQLEAAS